MPNNANLNKKLLFIVPNAISDYNSLIFNDLNSLQIKNFIVENAKTSRHFLKKIQYPIPLPEINMLEIDKFNDNFNEIEIYLNQNQKVGLMSESGYPCVADPGSRIVKLARSNQYKIVPLIGPSSIIMALASSGLNGQLFKFNGYLPIKTEEKSKMIKLLETETLNTNCTQLFIEAPYRNQKLFEDLLNFLDPSINLLVAQDITGENEWIETMKVENWRKKKIEFQKLPCIFGIGL